MAELTFRDFAGAIMGGDAAGAARVLEQLLALDPAGAAGATAHFQQQMASGPAFMGKAMGLRTAVTTGTDDEIRTLLADCFGLAEPALTSAITKLRQQYPKP